MFPGGRFEFSFRIKFVLLWIGHSRSGFLFLGPYHLPVGDGTRSIHISDDLSASIWWGRGGKHVESGIGSRCRGNLRNHFWVDVTDGGIEIVSWDSVGLAKTDVSLVILLIGVIGGMSQNRNKSNEFSVIFTVFLDHIEGSRHWFVWSFRWRWIFVSIAICPLRVRRVLFSSF